MNKIVKIFVTFVFLLGMFSCQSDEVRQKEDLIGEWHYEGVESGINIDVWLALSADDTFEMYQMVGEGAYWKSTGSYEVDTQKGVISGYYSDKTPWAYDYEFSVSGGNLTLVAVGTDSKTTYKRESVPAEVKEKTLDLTKSGPGEFVPYL